MICGFIDESGAPGKAAYSKDYFLASFVYFDSEEERDKSMESIERLRERLSLPDDYEFHCSSNSARPQIEFMKLLRRLNFKFITVAIHKNDFKRTASYTRISKLLMREIGERFTRAKIEMDSNPALYAELCKRRKEQKLKDIKIKERDSRTSRGVQIADYVANISAKKVKNTPKASEWYRYIDKKVAAFIEIS